MASLFVFISNALSWVGSLLSSFASWLGGAFFKSLDFFLSLVLWLLKGLLSLVFGFLEALVSLLPSMPDPPRFLDYALRVVGAANEILPISEFLSLATFWATIYGLIAAYRALAFIRGGGR